jgi:hypothetical protein
MYTGASKPAGQHYVPNDLSAYVFSAGAKTYTLWTDGTITLSDPLGDVTTLYQPAPATPATAPQLGQISLLDPTTAGSAALSVTPSGAVQLALTKDAPGANGAIVVSGQTTGMIIRGDSGANGGDWYNLAGSGGGNTIYGTAGDDVFELGGATALIDTLHTGKGFDIVHAGANGSDVDLTGASLGIPASTGVSAVVGGGTPLATHTVEANLTSLAATLDSTGAKTSVFEALLGSVNDTVTLSGAGVWEQIATISPGASLPAHATALTDATALDALFNGNANSQKAEKTLTGYLFEQVGPHGGAVRYATVWTDAAIAATFATPAATSFVQGMAQGGSGAALSASTGLAASGSTPVLAPPAAA